MTIIKLGDTAPDMPIPATGDQFINLADFRSKNLIVYFYPKDSTPGCTLEGIDFRDHMTEFTDLNTVIFGISRDSIKAHENFKCKQSFAFELLSDPDEKLCTLFDVIKMKNMYGKQVRGIERSTFLFDVNGVLVQEWRKVKVKGHVEAILQTLTQRIHQIQ